MADEVITNDFGLEAHRTDEFIDSGEDKRRKVKKALELRDAFDKIVAAGLVSEVETLIEASRQEGYNSGRDSEWERHQGEDW